MESGNSGNTKKNTSCPFGDLPRHMHEKEKKWFGVFALIVFMTYTDKSRRWSSDTDNDFCFGRTTQKVL